MSILYSVLTCILTLAQLPKKAWYSYDDNRLCINERGLSNVNIQRFNCYPRTDLSLIESPIQRILGLALPTRGSEATRYLLILTVRISDAKPCCQVHRLNTPISATIEW
ncbi:hypothetical protein GGS21DRAFT_226979 [Xylaria nigripes]|nr:hypothetical protein GGS21DRAFT_226979 [Xylaria nigripes]